jgi:hypothetical protein
MKSNPYNKREDKNNKKAFAETEKSVKSVAKDTNKTRRTETKKDRIGVTEKAATPKTRIKTDMKNNLGMKNKKDC